ncbi:MAG: MBL fold metallo-hydrolase [Chloroflexota bacterium]|nr:MAG: MBL fold metallo-hydrolase [Chloroflexota bacterium]
MEDQGKALLEQASLNAFGVPEITSADLYALLEKPSDLFLLDVRNDEDYASWKIEGRCLPETMHIFYGEFIENVEQAAQMVPEGRQVVVVCAKGGASSYVAEELRNRRQIPAVNLAGGMAAWGNHYETRLAAKGESFALYQVARVARGCLSHVLVSEGQAAIIDPLRHADPYQRLLVETGARLAGIFDTHAHADHISGGPALAVETGAPYHLHPYDAIHPFDILPGRLAYQMMYDGQVFEIGKLTLEVIHVPGHTLGQVNFLVREPGGSTFTFTGDNIFIQSFGRPDLGGQAVSWAPLVYESIFSTLKKRLPAETVVFPGHFSQHQEANEAGVFAGRLAELWEKNTDLLYSDRESFIRHVMSHLPEMPSQYVQIKRVNTGLHIPDEDEASELELGKNVCALSMD